MNQLLSITAKRICDPYPDASYLDQEGFEDRRQQYENQQFEFIGIRAEAEIVIAGVCQTITSGGLWGIESDSTPEYLTEVEQEETEQLWAILQSLGFSKDTDSTQTEGQDVTNSPAEPRHPICPECLENLVTADSLKECPGCGLHFSIGK
jgi:hypothetical protein